LIFPSSSSSGADPDSNPGIESEDDNQKDNNGTEGTEGTQFRGVAENNDTLPSIITIDQLRRYEDNIQNILGYSIENNRSISSSNNSQTMCAYPPNASHASQSSHQQIITIEQPESQLQTPEDKQNTPTTSTLEISDSIYRIYPHSDTLACRNCYQKGDIHFMKKHPCRGNKRENE
jgi:hypothetical protein